MPDFTKGKWEWGSNSIFANVYVGNHLIASLLGEGEERNERDANACLIASAPEMYELLQDTWEHDFNSFMHNLNRERRERFQRIKALLDRIDGEEDNNNA